MGLDRYKEHDVCRKTCNSVDPYGKFTYVITAVWKSLRTGLGAGRRCMVDVGAEKMGDYIKT